MAKRSTRQLVKDRLDGAATFTERAENALGQVSGAYIERGNKDGVLIDDMRETLTSIASLIRRFRRERA